MDSSISHERRNLVSVRVTSHFKRSLPLMRPRPFPVSSLPLHYLQNTLHCTRFIESLGQFSAVYYPHQNKEKNSTTIYVPKSHILQVQPPRSPDLGSLDIYLRRQCILFKMGVKRHLTKTILRSVKPFATATGPVKGRNSP